MKIETRDMAPDPLSEPEPEPVRRSLRGLYARAGIAVVAACMMLFALRWAIQTTTANTRQVSSTLTTLQDRIDQPDPFLDQGPQARYGKLKAHRSSTGPTLEPVDTR